MAQVVVLDAETTGIDPVYDRLVSLGLCFLDCPLAGEQSLWPEEYRFNPEKVMPPEVIAIHGITNEEAATYPKFAEHAQELYARLIKVDAIAGFNLFGLDLPILWSEFNRCGLDWNALSFVVIDAGTLFKKREPRTLKAAVEFYRNDPDWQGHSAGEDASATANVLISQLERYDLLGSDLEKISEESLYHRPVDMGGKLKRRDDGMICYAFGQQKDVPVIDNPGYARWMIDKDFHPHTKKVLLSLIEPEEFSGREGEF